MEQESRIIREVHSITVGGPHHPQPAWTGPALQYSPDGGMSPAPQKRRNRFLLFWSLSGGTVLSVVGFIALTLYQQYQDGLTELRNDLKHFNEASGELVKKDNLRTMKTHLFNTFKELQEYHAAEKTREAHIAQLDTDFKSMEERRQALIAELQRVRERLANVEGRLGALAPQPVATSPKGE